MYHAFWFDDEGNLHHEAHETLDQLVDALGGSEVVRQKFLHQFQPVMKHGAILIQGNELLWDFATGPVDYTPEDFGTDEDQEQAE